MTTLTREQEKVLDLLFSPPAARTEQTLRVSKTLRISTKALKASAAPDLLSTWLGLSSSDLRDRLKAMLARKDGVEQTVLGWLEQHPLDAAFEFLGGAALAFYLAEKEANPRVKSYVDAFYYIATCASVGYADIFAATQTGRAIAGLVMIVGPSITSRVLDQPKPPAPVPE